MKKLDIVGLCGSLRAASLNRHVLALAAEVTDQMAAFQRWIGAAERMTGAD